MLILILTPVRLLGEGVAGALSRRRSDIETDVIGSLQAAVAACASDNPPDAVIVDVTQAIDLDEIRDFHANYSELPLLALGLREQEAEVVAHGRAGFVGYISREDGIEELCSKVTDAVAGRFACTPEMAAGLMHGLFRFSEPSPAALDLSVLTVREEHVARLVSRGLSNKEIATQLQLSESTVKHHVHNILTKSGLSRRAEVIRSRWSSPWLAHSKLA